MDPKTYLTKKNFCTLPWLGVYIQPDGDVRNCAITKETLGNINTESLENILLGTVNQNIKKDMLSDVFHHRCNQCHALEKDQKTSFDQVSNRVWYLKTLRDNDMTVFDSPVNYRLKMLDLRWRNTCNFSCVYCGPDLSSAWAAELNQPPKINNRALEESLDYIYKNLATVENIYLAGGEPLMIKENINLLNHIKEVKPDVEIRINTNLSLINNEIYNLLKTFKNVHWTISVDNIGKEFEYVRYGGKWDLFVNNLTQLRNDFEKINFNSVWFVMNGKSIFSCIDFLLEMGFHENTFIVNPLDDPIYWHVNNLPGTVLEEIRTEISKRLLTVNPQYALYNSLTLMLNYTNNPFNKNLQDTFKEIERIDKRRGLNSREIFKELYSYE
jgi:radical SAM protein with 4Fe4S-binding SPASM domain